MQDLAGSERAGRTKTEGHSLAEGSLINLSLSSLTRVVSGLTDEAHPKTHIPYRQDLDSGAWHCSRSNVMGLQSAV